MSTEAAIRPSESLKNVRYEIRGGLARRAHELQRQGYEIISLNIGNPGLFGFRTPETMRLAMIENLPESEAYCHQKGIFPAREAIVMQQQARGITGVSAEEVFLGNGVSELIDLVLRALLNDGDEVLVPSPDYPLWTAAVNLNRGSRRALSVQAGKRLRTRSGRDRSHDHAAHARAGGHQSEQSHGRDLSAPRARGARAARREAQARGLQR
jgi:aspartate/methionine/tyrosine aminotransferase